MMGGGGAGLAAAVRAGGDGAKYVAEKEHNVFQQ